MSGYSRGMYGLTATKMEWWHRYHPHRNLPKAACPICNYRYGRESMEVVASYLRDNGFNVIGVGNAHVNISAPGPSYTGPGGLTTAEVDRLYRLISGRDQSR